MRDYPLIRVLFKGIKESGMPLLFLRTPLPYCMHPFFVFHLGFLPSYTPFSYLCTFILLFSYAPLIFDSPAPPYLFWICLMLLFAVHVSLHTPPVNTSCTTKFTDSTTHLCIIPILDLFHFYPHF